MGFRREEGERIKTKKNLRKEHIRMEISRTIGIFKGVVLSALNKVVLFC